VQVFSLFPDAIPIMDERGGIRIWPEG
jgi:hypothetical protein